MYLIDNQLFPLIEINHYLSSKYTKIIKIKFFFFFFFWNKNNREIKKECKKHDKNMIENYHKHYQQTSHFFAITTNITFFLPFSKIIS